MPESIHLQKLEILDGAVRDLRTIIENQAGEIGELRGKLDAMRSTVEKNQSVQAQARQTLLESISKIWPDGDPF